MLPGTFRTTRALGLAFATLIPFTAVAQRAFTYTATDVRTVTITDRSAVSIPVTTVIIISGGPSPDFSAQGPTEPYSVTLRPPAGMDSRLVQAMVDGHLIRLDLVSTTVDGEYLATANVPKSAPQPEQIHILWTTKESGYVETTVSGSLAQPHFVPTRNHHVFVGHKLH